VIDVKQPTLNRRHDATQPAFPLCERPRRQILTVHRQQIEREEVRPVAPEQQVVEVAATVRVEADDLAVEHGIGRADGVRDLGLEDAVLGEDVAAARHQAAMMPVDVCERPEPVVLQFEQAVAVIKRFRDVNQRAVRNSERSDPEQRLRVEARVPR